MQLILIRHALPLRSDESADPPLAELGHEQAGRLPDALSRFPITRTIASTQLRAVQTGTPVAAQLGLDLGTDDRITEYDRDFGGYIPLEDARTELRDAFGRIKAGHLPEQVDEAAFRARVLGGIAAAVDGIEHTDTVALFAHGGVINIFLQDILGTPKALGFPIDYCSITRVLFSRNGTRSVSSVNETHHVWDLLPRNR
ncbi:histidine phosphatase family protein [Rhodococcus sp. 14-2470-1a]|uniref:histidine phosphatase family protein n=1 Tax=Rhodococcus sp. 14-2470-1a TaxID=2023150 RepID=UPI000B9A4180|nr:histidine phosphatase family protein [Rhodococcus sp. 14-2470-1a]OZF49766.1 histidine phosphatase family protein [Rhodococcus sp. 14-2470-1a]